VQDAHGATTDVRTRETEMPAISGGEFVAVGGASLLGSHIGEQLLAGGAREVVASVVESVVEF
jgi:hypothetical protein